MSLLSDARQIPTHGDENAIVVVDLGGSTTTSEKDKWQMLQVIHKSHREM